MIGRSLGHYEIVEKLGEGGMGAVYKARDTRLDRFVALKVLPPDRLASPERLRRFTQEAKSASALNHPNIITIYEIAADQGIDYIAMEYVQGATLGALIGKGNLRISDAVKYATQMADALAAAHAAGLLHRDLKPANVMVNEAGRVKVLDFGLAKLTDRSETGENEATRTAVTREGEIVGTIAYMSPEQAEGKPLDFRSDIFSFGAVLYEMVTGRRAFSGDSQASTMSAILRDDPKPAAALREDVPPDLDKLIARCLRKDPSRRVQTMRDLQAALEDVTEDSSRSRATAAPAKAVRRPAFWFVAAALLVAMAGTAAYWMTRGRSTSSDVVAPLSMLPLTGNPGRELGPSFSPDGNQIAYSWNGEKEDNFDIYVKLIGPGAPLRLTTNPGLDIWPVWSPDGRWVAFLRMEGNEGAAIMLIPALGGTERRLSGGFVRFVVRAMAWAPDSQHLIFSGRTNRQDANALSVLSVATGVLRPLTAPPTKNIGGDCTPALSPDGRTLAFFRGESGANLELFTLALSADLQPAGEPRQITFDQRRSFLPAWSPDGRDVIYFAETQAGRGNLWRVPADGSGKPQPLAGVGESGSAPAISPRGNRLAYSRSVTDQNIWAVDVANGKTGSPKRIIGSTLRDIEPRYSPDGAKIVFASDRSGRTEVWTASSDGSNQVQLTDRKTQLTSGARWSPDNQSLAFLSVTDGQQEIYTISAAGGAPVRLTNNPAHDTAPSWSHDGKWIYFGSNRSNEFQVWKMPSSGGEAVQITKKGGYAALESSDGKYLYYAGRIMTDGISRVPVGGGEEVPVIRGVDTWGNFAVTDRGLYFAGSDKRTIRFYEFSTRQEKLILKTDKLLGFGLSATPDGRSVIFTQTDRDSDELILVENFR